MDYGPHFYLATARLAARTTARLAARPRATCKIDTHTIDSIVKGLETAHVRPLKRVRTPRAILVTSCYELSQFRAPEKERTR